MADKVYMPRPGEVLSLTQLRRMAELASRSGSTMGQSGFDSFNSSSGLGVAGKTRQRFLIQLTRQSISDPTQYSWQEVIRYNNGYTTNADGRSSEFNYVTGLPNFPARDINDSTTAIVTFGGVEHQYEAWVADDGSSVLFDAQATSTTFSGAQFFFSQNFSVAYPATDFVTLALATTSYNIGGYHPTGNKILVPSDGYYLFGCNADYLVNSVGGGGTSWKGNIGVRMDLSNSFVRDRFDIPTDPYTVQPGSGALTMTREWLFSAGGVGDGPFVEVLPYSSGTVNFLFEGHVWIQKVG